MERFDLIVIGCGPAGEKGAAQAAYFGKRVAVIERADHVGGAGINTGTVPSKTLRETALYFSGLRQRGLYGIDYSLRGNLSVADFMHRKRVVVDAQRSLIDANLARHGIRRIQGEASLRDAHTVRVQGVDGATDFAADTLLIATGSSPLRPAEIPFDGRLVYDSDDILSMQRIPASMVVIGGGVIGTEYASIFTALGVQVTLVEPRGRVLPFLDGEIAARLSSHLQRLGLRFVYHDRVVRLEPLGEHVRVHFDSGVTQEVDIVMVAAGRQSNVQGLGLEAVGVELGKRGLVVVDEHYRTSVPNIYAAGDVIGFPALASTSMEQARVAMVHAFDLGYKQRVSPVLPLAVYAIPEISAVGLTEDDCREAGTPCLVGKASFEASARGQIIGDTSGMVKLVFAPADKRLLGVHIIGEQASELIHVGAQAIARGETIDCFIDAVYNYPTLSECYKYAAYDGLGALQRLPAADLRPADHA